MKSPIQLSILARALSATFVTVESLAEAENIAEENLDNFFTKEIKPLIEAGELYVTTDNKSYFNMYHPDNAPIHHKTVGSVGADVPSSEEVTIAPGECKLIPTVLELSKYRKLSNTEFVLLTPRSSFYNNYKLLLANSVGVIDSDFPNVVQFMYVNMGTEPVTIPKGEYLGQAIVTYAARDVFPTKCVKRTGGFGSTTGTDQSVEK